MTKQVRQQGYVLFFVWALAVWGIFLPAAFGQEPQFSSNGLIGENVNNPTTLQFGPDGRLYVGQQDGTIYAYTIERDNAPPGSGSYSVIATEVINLIKNNTPNHNDDGTLNTTQKRQLTGLQVAGTAENPVLYVTSSDWRISVGNDSGLDTNSGVISQLTWNGSSWTKVDLVRGLTRCEENHAINGLDLDEAENMLYVQIGGHTNKGAPGNNFSGTPEYFFSGALLRVDLDILDAMPVYTDARTGTTFKYDLPTLNDPTRPDIDNSSPNFPYSSGHPLYNATIDVGDPFGGNNSLNQAIPETGGPVQVFVPGFRNAYDVVITESGRIYTSDNGPNGGWGGTPLIYDADDNLKGYFGQSGVTYDQGAGDYITNEFNEGGSTGMGDPLHFVGTTADPNGTYYGGHPAPIRAFPERAGIIVYEEISGTWTETARYELANLLSGVSGYFQNSFSIADFPDDPVQGGYYPTGAAGVLDIVGASTNGIDEYTATNFNGAMQGNLLTASYNGNINRYVLNPAGDNADVIEEGFFSGFGSQPLDLTAQGDGDLFPGTIWVVTYGADNITIFEPADYGNCPQPGEEGYADEDDFDGDGYTNADEIANGTNHCSGGSKPTDNDGDFVSDLLDTDDDDDGIPDVNDAFAIDPDNGTTTDLPVIYPFWNNDPGTGFFGLGFTGLMTNGTTDYLNQFDGNKLAPGGAAGNMLVEEVTAGDAFQANNSQANGFQFGVNVDVNSPPFTVHSKLLEPFFLVNGSPTTPENFQSFGIFIGTGDQDNYLKVVFAANGGNGGIQVLLENGGTVQSSQTYGVPGILNTGEVDIYLNIDPGANTVQPFVSINAGQTITALGNPLSLPASFLNAGDDKGLAVGLISTSTGPGSPFDATWDFINISENTPGELEALIDPLDFGTLPVNSSASVLNIPLRNNGGPADGDIQVTGITFSGPDSDLFAGNNPSFSIAPGSSSDNGIAVTFTPGATPGVKTATASISHSGTNSPLTVQLTAEVVDQPQAVIRVNAGGAAISNPNDGGPAWLANTGNGAQSGNYGSTVPSYTNNTGSVSTQNLPLAGRHPSIPDYITDAEYTALFANERYDPASGYEMLWTFTVDPGDYEVRLYYGNGFSGTSDPGERIFDVFINGVQVVNDKDLSGQYGHQVGVMEAYQTQADNGLIQIEFIHQTENPLVNAIEILRGGAASADPYVLGAKVMNQVIDPLSNGVDATIVTTGLNLPNGALDPATVNTSTVKLVHNGTNQPVANFSANAVAGNENIVLSAQNLAFNTTYRLEIDGAEDETGASLTPFTTFTFTTDAGGMAPDLSAVEFEQVTAVSRNEHYTSVTKGPDGKLYALTQEGLILRWTIAADGTLTGEQAISSLQTAEGGDRLALSLVFDPAASAGNLIAWVTHSDAALGNATPWSGKLTQLSGANLQNVQDYLVGLPRAANSHATNSVVFDKNGVMYLSQGHTSAVGAPGSTGYGNQPERLLSGAVLEIDVDAITTPPLNVQTADGGSYNPAAPNAPVTIFASGIRNAFDLVWHSNGQLYAPTNGAEADQLVPALPGVPSFALTAEPRDYLLRLEAGGYYGHPSPVRGELVLNGGNPTAGPDPAEVGDYPVGTLPDPNYRGFAYEFGGSESPNGIIEYKSNTFGGALKGQLLVLRYNQGFDIVVLTPGGTQKNIVVNGDQLPDGNGIFNGLDLTEDPATGNIYVAVYGGDILLLRSLSAPAEELYINAGGPAYTGQDGKQWIADQYFVPAPGSTYSKFSPINNTADDALYQTERFGKDFSYQIPVANGSYAVELHFAELFHDAAGDRVFDVSIEGNLVLDNYDPFAVADAANGDPAGNGAFYALVELFENIQVNDGSLDIQFTVTAPDGADNAKISAICVKSQPSGDLASLTVDVDLQGRTDQSGDYEVKLFSTTDNQTPLYTFNQAANGNGVLTLTGIAPAAYDVWIDRAQYLSRVKMNQSLAPGANALAFSSPMELRAGDADDDNGVTLVDFSLLSTSYGLSEGSVGFNANVDFDGNGTVAILDFSLLSSNFNTYGETPLTGQPVLIREETPANTADLHLQWTRETVRADEVVEAKLLLASHGQPVDGLQALIGFDPALLEVTDIEWEGAFEVPLQTEVDEADGRLRLAAGSFRQFPAGERAVATIRFRTRQAGNALLYFARAEDKIANEVTFAGQPVTGMLYNGQLQIGRPELRSMEVAAFPNPANNQFSLIVDTPANPLRTQVRLLNADGTEVWTKVFEGPVNEQVDVSRLSKGGYILHVRSGDVNRFQRIVIQ